MYYNYNYIWQQWIQQDPLGVNVPTHTCYLVCHFKETPKVFSRYTCAVTEEIIHWNIFSNLVLNDFLNIDSKWTGLFLPTRNNHVNTACVSEQCSLDSRHSSGFLFKTIIHVAGQPRTMFNICTTFNMCLQYLRFGWKVNNSLSTVVSGKWKAYGSN